ncbi:choline BCCT transporter BetT [Geminicoccaceae bacterium 1502E]|nr:choline BCCT transporter BetT [Geminicoccaceae bacterium 1502E]
MQPNPPSSSPRTTLNPPVFFGSALLILAFVLFAMVAPERAEAIFKAMQSWITDGFGWFYVLAVAIFLLFVIGLAISSVGDIKLGPDHSEPEFSNTSWFAMLFSAGMGIGLMFFGVAEPLLHFADPPTGPGLTVEAAREAMKISFFHWGVHAWAIYAVVGLSLAYFGFRHGLPLTIRSSLYPLIGDRIYGPIGHTVDIFAVLGTMFGVATSLGLGVLQVNAGLNFLFEVPVNLTVQIILIAVITLFATISVASGLDAGIRRISELNLLLACALLLFVLLSGPTLFLLRAFVQNTGSYMADLVYRTFNLYAYKPTSWIGGWTLFYWGWWIAWSPFVGMFIARISRGRTIREFVVGVLFVPTGLTFLWFTAFGDTALFSVLADPASPILTAVRENMPLALFEMLREMPFSAITSLLATVLVVTFFVTSSDSGSLVIDIITSGGADTPPVWQRIFWSVTEGVVAAMLLVAGGLTALQTVSIAGALPFSVIMLLICWGLWRALSAERLRRQSFQRAIIAQIGAVPVPWQQRLGLLVSYPRREKVAAFLRDVAEPALRQVVEELCRRGQEAVVEARDGRVTLTVSAGDHPFHYAVRMRAFQTPDFAFPEFEPRPGEEHRYYRAEVYLAEGGQQYDIMGYSREQVIADAIAHFERHLHYVHVTA